MARDESKVHRNCGWMNESKRRATDASLLDSVILINMRSKYQVMLTSDPLVTATRQHTPWLFVLLSFNLFLFFANELTAPCRRPQFGCFVPEPRNFHDTPDAFFFSVWLILTVFIFFGSYNCHPHSATIYKRSSYCSTDIWNHMRNWLWQNQSSCMRRRNWLEERD